MDPHWNDKNLKGLYSEKKMYFINTEWPGGKVSDDDLFSHDLSFVSHTTKSYKTMQLATIAYYRGIMYGLEEINEAKKSAGYELITDKKTGEKWYDSSVPYVRRWTIECSLHHGVLEKDLVPYISDLINSTSSEKKKHIIVIAWLHGRLKAICSADEGKTPVCLS